jgi:kumamolisin
MRKNPKPNNWWKILVVLSFILALGLSVGMALAALPAASTTGAASHNAPPNMADTVPQQVRDGSATLVGKHANADTLVVLFMLPFKDQAGLEAFLADVSNPASPNYRHYLTLDEENARYNPDVSREQNVNSWLQSSGVTGMQLVPNHLYVYVKASAATFSKLLNVQINDYTLNGRTFYAPDRTPTLPSSVSGDVNWIAGLSNIDLIQKMSEIGSRSKGAVVSPRSSNRPQNSPPYTPQDFATAYDVNPLLNAGYTGNGTKIAITLWSLPPSDATLNSWSSQTGSPVATLTNGRLSIILTDGTPSTDQDDVEASMDIESSSGTATGANIRYYEATLPNNSNLANALNVAGTDAANNRFITNSWGEPDSSNGRNTMEPVLLANSATGHDYLFSSGDNGSWAGGQDPLPQYPTSSVYVTSIGGTRFNGDISGGWPGEDTWLYAPGSPPEGSGGGFSLFTSRPSWQVAPGFPSGQTHRGEPDISAVADPATGMYVCSDHSGCGTVGGTSLASPLWAAMMDITDQYVAANGGAHLGFVNPAVYQLVNSSQPYPPYHDITNGTNGAYNAGPGWDAVTGLGSPDLYNFARDLVPAPHASPTPAASPTACTGFSDVPPGSTFYSYISCLSGLGIINGYSDCTFRPGNNVTRGQAAKIIANAANYTDNIPSSRQTFNDVPPSSTFWLYVERVALHGAISGYPCGGSGEPCPGTYFRPGNNLTRGQLAKIDSNAAGYSDNIPSSQQTFRDVSHSNAFWVYVERVYLHGVISGYACGGSGEPCPGIYYRPGSNVTRGQTSKIVANTFYPNCQPHPTATPTQGAPLPTNTQPPASPTRTDTPPPGSTNTPTRTPTVGGPTVTPTCVPLPASFSLDDGSQETSIGLNDNISQSYPAIWLNRFIPAAGSYPITLNQISIQFPSPTFAGIDLTGRAIDLLVYLDTDGNNDPSNATKLAQIHTTVLAANGSTFSNYPVNVAVPGPGDIYVGFSDTYNSGGFSPINYPAPEDTTSTYARSWVAGMNTVTDPDYNNLGNNNILSTIDALGFPGNWVIRASGTTSQCSFQP